MHTKYILISCDPDDTNEIFTALKDIQEISEAKMVEGPYDIIVKIEGNNEEKLEIISGQLKKKIDKIKHTLTLTATQN